MYHCSYWQTPPILCCLGWLSLYMQHGNLSVVAHTFNYRLSRAIMVVENAFGYLKGRWYCLLKRNDAAIEDFPTIISAYCVLHNICEVHKEQFDDTWMEELASGVNAPSPTQNTSTNTNAESIRTALWNLSTPKKATYNYCYAYVTACYCSYTHQSNRRHGVHHWKLRTRSSLLQTVLDTGGGRSVGLSVSVRKAIQTTCMRSL